MFRKQFAVVLVVCFVGNVIGLDLSTTIQVVNNFAQPVYVDIEGRGLGGCEVLVNSGVTDKTSCNCLWGTFDYRFCAYKPATGTALPPNVPGQTVVPPAGTETPPTTPTEPQQPPAQPAKPAQPAPPQNLPGVANPNLPVIVPHALVTPLVFENICAPRDGLELLCSDLTNIGNCYGKSYTCTVSAEGGCVCLASKKKGGWPF